jgi:endonuclease YncB( thermonuclease family)
MVLILQSAARRDAEEKAAGLLAKEFVEETLHVGGTYTLTTREKGKFGRYLGVIMLSDRTSINAALVSRTPSSTVPRAKQTRNRRRTRG